MLSSIQKLFEDNEKDCEILIRGNILSGSLTGSWGNVKIVSGNILMDQQYPKQPRYANKNRLNFDDLFINP